MGPVVASVLLVPLLVAAVGSGAIAATHAHEYRCGNRTTGRAVAVGVYAVIALMSVGMFAVTFAMASAG